jgi:hypothetical protein
MVRILLTVAAFLLLAARPLGAGEIKEIELTDGSVVTGEVVSMSNGLYTIRTDAMGTVTVPDSKVRSIRRKGMPSTTSSAAPGGEVPSLEGQMASDPAIMEMIRGLKDDPDFGKVLEDPEMMRAVETGDLATLIANPKFLKLLNNSTVQDIQMRMAK